MTDKIIYKDTTIVLFQDKETELFGANIYYNDDDAKTVCVPAFALEEKTAINYAKRVVRQNA